MARINRRAYTLPTIPVRDNRIFDIFRMRDGYVVNGLSDGAFYYRRHVRGTVFTGRMVDAERLPKTATR